jgi:hypothetical protein
MQAFMEDIKTDSHKLNCGNSLMTQFSGRILWCGSVILRNRIFHKSHFHNHKKQRKLVLQRTVCLSPDFMMLYCSARQYVEELL